MSCKGVTQEIRELVSELIDEKTNWLLVSWRQSDWMSDHNFCLTYRST
jgi:hypothetical protein